MKNPSIIPSNK